MGRIGDRGVRYPFFGVFVALPSCRLSFAVDLDSVFPNPYYRSSSIMPRFAFVAQGSDMALNSKYTTTECPIL
jgi:hypothetical protein